MNSLEMSDCVRPIISAWPNRMSASATVSRKVCDVFAGMRRHMGDSDLQCKLVSRRTRESIRLAPPRKFLKAARQNSRRFSDLNNMVSGTSALHLLV